MRLHGGGLFLADNVLWRGEVVTANDDDADTAALRFNQQT